MYSSLLVAAVCLLNPHDIDVFVREHAATVNIACNCPRCPPCPCPTLAWGKVLPFVISVDAEPVETWEFTRPLQYGLDEWTFLQAKLGAPVERYYKLHSVHAYNAYEMSELCVTGPFDDFDPEPIRYCTFAHLAAVHVTMHRGNTWWMDLWRDGYIDLHDLAIFQNQFGRVFDSNEGWRQRLGYSENGE